MKIEEEFSLDNRLQADCHKVADLPLSRLLLLNDCRWPWLVLVPRITGAIELFDLGLDEQIQIIQETSIVGETLRTITACEKVNTAAIGNVVRQLHIHVIARSEGDANWPGPVWGYGKQQPYRPDQANQLIQQIKQNILSKGQISWTE